jgi:hypothetical protein
MMASRLLPLLAAVVAKPARSENCGIDSGARRRRRLNDAHDRAAVERAGLGNAATNRAKAPRRRYRGIKPGAKRSTGAHRPISRVRTPTTSRGALHVATS